jgi:hypothetical protein
MNSIFVGNDLPPELAAYSDGDDGSVGAFHPEIVGCGPDVSGLPWYTMTSHGVRTPVARQRLLAAIAKLSPKMRRRVLGRLRSAAAVAGAIRAATPTIAGWANIAGLRPGGDVSIGRCPYANVAGALTP